MLAEGTILGFFTLAGFAMIYKKLPKGCKTFFVKHPLFADILLAVVFYSVMGFTIVAHVAAAVMTLGAMALLYIAKNPEEFEWLYDSIDRGKSMMKDAMLQLKQYNDKYKQEKALKESKA